MNDWIEDDANSLAHHWPMAPNDLLPRERWLWWEQLWSDVLMLGEQDRLRPGGAGHG